MMPLHATILILLSSKFAIVCAETGIKRIEMFARIPGRLLSFKYVFQIIVPILSFVKINSPVNKLR